MKRREAKGRDGMGWEGWERWKRWEGRNGKGGMGMEGFEGRNGMVRGGWDVMVKEGCNGKGKEGK